MQTHDDSAAEERGEDSMSIEEQLTDIRTMLHRMDRRDRWRTIGGFVRTLIGLVPVVILLLSMLYVYRYGDALIEKIAGTAARQAATMATGGAVDAANSAGFDIESYIREKLAQ